MKHRIRYIVLTLVMGSFALLFSVNTVSHALEESSRERGSGGRTEESRLGPSQASRQREDRRQERDVEQEARDNQRQAERDLYNSQRAEDREVRKKSTRERIDGKKLEICQKKQTQIVTVMGRVEGRSQEAYDRITNIYRLTTEYKTNNELTIDGYDGLVSDVESSQGSAQLAIEALSEVPEFYCDSDGPKADLQNFRDTRLQKVEALKEYRASVKKLLEIVKSSAEKSSDVDNTDDQYESSDNE